jgi:glyoxylase-like metal-dependent hydrolase (beta-lactamase superfamily II)
MTSMMILEQLFDRESSTYTYLVADPVSREAALIDPVLGQIDRDLQLLSELGLVLTAVLETHVHADHVTAAGLLRTRTGAKTYASERGAPCVDVRLRHADVIRLGDLVITALSTPGHTDDGMCFLIDGHVFTGDTLLIRGCGRADFQNGNPGELFDSITRVLFRLPPETVVLPAHDYKGLTRSTIGHEVALNPRLQGRDRAAFVTLMNALNLPPPAKLTEAVPANRACGQQSAADV